MTWEENAQIPKIQEKWQEIVFSTGQIDRAKAERAVQLAYAVLEKKLPSIVFCTSPQDAFQKLANYYYTTKDNQKRIEEMARHIEQVLSQQLRSELINNLNVEEVNELVEKLAPLLAEEIGEVAIVPTSPRKELSKQLEYEIILKVGRQCYKNKVDNCQLIDNLSVIKLETQLCNKLRTASLNKLLLELESLLEKSLTKPLWREVITRMYSLMLKAIKKGDSKYLYLNYYGLWNNSVGLGNYSVGDLDCNFSVLNVGNQKSWSSLQLLIKDCGWIYATEEICFVCDRPRWISIDKQNRICGIGFSDGYKILLDDSPRYKVSSPPQRFQTRAEIWSSIMNAGAERDLHVSDYVDYPGERSNNFNKIVGIIIYVLISLPLLLLSILPIVPKMSLAAIFYRVNLMVEGILFILGANRGASLPSLVDDRNNRVRETEQDLRRSRLFVQIPQVNISEIFDTECLLRIYMTREQKVMMKNCRKKWLDREFYTERINHKTVKEATRSLYTALGLSEPEISLASSPYGALQKIIDLTSLRQRPLKKTIANQLAAEMIPTSVFSSEGFICLSREIGNGSIWQREKQRIQQIIARQVGINIIDENSIDENSIDENIYIDILTDELKFMNFNCIMPDLWSEVAAWLDFHSNVLKAIDISEVSYHFGRVIQECGWIFPFEDICVICDRPLKINLDNQYRLHGEGEPAVEYADGFSIYAYRGVGLPEKYGKINPDNWRSQWILEEQNAELRRVLIQGIGYDRICQELSSLTLDIWKEYTLLKLANNIDENPREATFLLKMTCPSTGQIHALRVPPDMRSAREAISWVNGGIDPEEFSVQT